MPKPMKIIPLVDCFGDHTRDAAEWSDALRFTAESVAEAVEAERERIVKLLADSLDLSLIAHPGPNGDETLLTGYTRIRAALSPTQGTAEGGIAMAITKPKFPVSNVQCPSCNRNLCWGHTITLRKKDRPTSREERTNLFCPFCDLSYGPGTTQFNDATQKPK
jgi:NMD protein affecting ribosome stability and mRNA decay